MYLAFPLQVFTGNSNTESVVRHDLQHSIVARYLRFIPLGWSEEGQIGLRMEIYGCSYCEFTLFQYTLPAFSASILCSDFTYHPQLT